MSEEIIDVAGKKLSRDEWKQIVGTGKICRLSKEQFRGWCVTADRAEYADRVWDLYAAMPAGTYYVKTANPFHEDINFQEVNRNGSPCQWFSKKRFEGFTTKVPFNPVYGFGCFPDREVYVPWDLRTMVPSIKINRGSSLWDNVTQLDENGVRELIDKNYTLWQRFFWKVIPEEFREDVRDLREHWKFTLEHLSQCRGRKYETWDDVYQHLYEINEIRTPTKFKVEQIHPMDKYEGYAPEVTEVHSPQEISDFIIRFLSFQDNGKVIPAIKAA